MKVKTFESFDRTTLDERINVFIQDKTVTDIKLTVTGSQNNLLAAMIMYEELPSTNEEPYFYD